MRLKMRVKTDISCNCKGEIRLSPRFCIKYGVVEGDGLELQNVDGECLLIIVRQPDRSMYGGLLRKVCKLGRTLKCNNKPIATAILGEDVKGCYRTGVETIVNGITGIPIITRKNYYSDGNSEYYTKGHQ